MRALIYARVSLDASAEGRSVTEQETECRAWATREGWHVTDVITETGSASRYARSTHRRSRWPELTAAIASGRFDILLTWEASRATRQLDEYAALRDLCVRHGVLWGYSGTVYDLTQRDGRFRTGLDALLSEDESARSSERVRRAVRARAAQGKPHGKLPYGYRREYDPATGALLRQVPHEETAPVVREIYSRVLAGDGTRTIAVDLSNRGVAAPRPPTSRTWPPQQWLPVTVRRIATSPTYAGKRTHQGVVVGDAQWEALVDEDTWARAVQILTNPARVTRTGDSQARWLLSGIATCSECGAPMRRIKNRGRDTYCCMRSGCMKVARNIGKVDAWVSQVIVELLTRHRDQLDDTTTDRTPEIDTARTELKALRDRLDGFVTAAADGQVSPAALAAIEARLGPQIRTAEQALRRLLVPRALDGLDLTDPAAAWEAMTVAQRRAVVRDLVDVRILPSGRGQRVLDTSLIEITPRW